MFKHVLLNNVIILWYYFSSRTKVFIRFPRVLFATEDALQTKKHDLGEWRGKADTV